MNKILLSDKKNYCLLDDEDWFLCSKYSWSITNQGYVRTLLKTVNRKRYYVNMHRFILNLIDPKIIVDHINMDKTDNRKSNLRICKHQQNQFNRPYQINNKWNYKGVSFCKRKNRFRALIKLNGKQIYIGVYKTPIEAALAYNAKAKELFGEYAYLNQITP